jgi:DNA-binding response OmpR family regulator
VAEVLIAEEAPTQRALAQFILETQGGHQVRFAQDAGSVFKEIERGEPDVLLLEAALPHGQSGAPTFDLCRQLRRRVTAPILMVSGQTDPAHRVQGLRAGADDFLPKPWDPDELLERINALLRRARRSELGPTGASVRAGDLRLHLIDRDLWVRDRGPLQLTPVECRLLYAMMQKPGAVWAREELLRRLWDVPDGFDGSAATVEAHVSRLRRKIERVPKKPEYLTTIRGEGYQLNVTR